MLLWPEGSEPQKASPFNIFGAGNAEEILPEVSQRTWAALMGCFSIFSIFHNLLN